ncbi:hypothetical protein ACFVYG_08860 [Streptomyces sp. NPDC058256]|uniref:hypothetical protein n=1 Tax=Streptomyces sp. NPDC058256 TaxID=3346408 RepID=UPI0036E2707D
MLDVDRIRGSTLGGADREDAQRTGVVATQENSAVQCAENGVEPLVDVQRRGPRRLGAARAVSKQLGDEPSESTDADLVLPYSHRALTLRSDRPLGGQCAVTVKRFVREAQHCHSKPRGVGEALIRGRSHVRDGGSHPSAGEGGENGQQGLGMPRGPRNGAHVCGDLEGRLDREYVELTVVQPKLPGLAVAEEKRKTCIRYVVRDIAQR